MTNPPLPESFQLDSGFRDDMVLTIHSAYFAPHADYMDGKVLMLWLIGLDEAGDPGEVRLSVGADWQSNDGGNTISHPTKKKQQINKNSIYGHWLSYCFEIPELRKELVSRSDALGGIGPLDARIWIDMILQLEKRTIEFGKNIDPQERLMPTQYLGLTTDTGITTIAPTPITSSTEEAKLSPAELVAQAQARKQQETAVTNGSPIYSRAIKMAADAPDFATFLSIALSDDEILADDELSVRVADESQIWAEAHR